jgi:hypothetical protein
MPPGPVANFTIPRRGGRNRRTRTGGGAKCFVVSLIINLEFAWCLPNSSWLRGVAERKPRTPAVVNRSHGSWHRPTHIPTHPPKFGGRDVGPTGFKAQPQGTQILGISVARLPNLAWNSPSFNSPRAFENALGESGVRVMLLGSIWTRWGSTRKSVPPELGWAGIWRIVWEGIGESPPCASRSWA